MRKTFRYRLYPTKTQTAALTAQLREACNLYNAALQERIEHWRLAGKSINYFHQANQLKEIRAEGYNELTNFSCCQDVLRRLDKAFKAFFRRVKAGETPGFPRFKPHQRFDSITFPSYGDGSRLLDSGKLRVQGIGEIKVKLHRPIAGTIKTVTLKREAGKFYACFSVECEAIPLPLSSEAIGIDVGLTSFAVLADGTEIENPCHYRKAQAKLRIAQRRVARRKKGGKGRKKAVTILRGASLHVSNQRNDFQNKISTAIIAQYGLIAIEALNIKGLASGMLAKSVHDAAWGGFFQKLAYKAESAGRVLVEVDPRGTSQRCSGCGVEVRKTLKDRWHDCPACGLSVPRDYNSAMEVLRLGLSRVAPTWAVMPCVATEAVCVN